MSWIDDLKKLLNGKVLTEESALNDVSSDFGRMITRVPKAVVRPTSSEDIAKTIQFANQHGIPVATRGEAHSQTGQSLSDGIVISLTSMNKVLNVDKEKKLVTVETGIIWRDLVNHLKTFKLIPPVLTNNLGVTVGGTLSMAGLGIASFRYGAQGDNVVAMEVVTGDGKIVQCSPTENTELFNSVRSTLGQFAVITKATLKVREHLSHIRMYYLLYDKLSVFMKDAEVLMSDDRFGYIESWCVPCPQGFKKINGQKQAFAEWFFPMHVSIEYDPANPPKDEELLKGLNFYKHTHTEDYDIYEFANRLEPLFELWKRMGYWKNTHPWMESILPWSTAEMYINQVLANLPPQSLGGGHILLWPSSGKTSSIPYFMRPIGDFVMGFGILPGLPKEFLETALPKLQMASDASMMMGGKRYLSGIIQFDQQRWKQHYGEHWNKIQELKHKYDPKGILNPGFIEYEKS